MTTAIKVIAFDLDDTLWDVRPVLIAAEKELAAWLQHAVPGLRYDIDAVRAVRTDLLEARPELGGMVTELRRSTIERLLMQHGLPLSAASALASDAMEIFLAARNRIDLFEGAHEALTILAPRFVLGVLTNGNADVHRLGLGHLFRFAFSAEDVGAPKPSPALFEAALDRTKVLPGEMVYVGDDPHLDVDAANRAGLRTIWVKGANKPEPGETAADVTIEHVRHLPAAISRLEN